MPCYFATLHVEKLDGTEGLIYSPLVSKRVVINDTGRPPFLKDKIGSLYAQTGERTELPFSTSVDPEGRKVIMIFSLGRVAQFTYWDPYTHTIIVEEGKTVPKVDEGEYPITLRMIEVIRGVRMPAIEETFMLTIGYFPPPPKKSHIPVPLN